jgi:iron(III) transport system permease protein
VFADPFIIGVVVNTLIFTVTATVVALLFGLPVAWLVERTTLPGKTLLYAIMTLGLLIPGIYTAMGWTLIAHPRMVSSIAGWSIYSILTTARSISPRPSAWASFKG